LITRVFDLLQTRSDRATRQPRGCGDLRYTPASYYLGFGGSQHPTLALAQTIPDQFPALPN
jgi:hypothetical protein